MTTSARGAVEEEPDPARATGSLPGRRQRAGLGRAPWLQAGHLGGRGGLAAAAAACEQHAEGQRGARFLAVAGNDVEHAGRDAGFERQLGQLERTWNAAPALLTSAHAQDQAAAKEARTIAAMEAAGSTNPDVMRQVEKSILLQSIDGLWREHLVTLDHLSKVVGWRGIAQRDPLNEYKQEAYELFQSLLANLRELVTAARQFSPEVRFPIDTDGNERPPVTAQEVIDAAAEMARAEAVQA